MGLTFFAALMTLWLARPVKLTLPVKFMVGGITGFLLGGMAGLLQANYALNTVLHNTQWGLGSTSTRCSSQDSAAYSSRPSTR